MSSQQETLERREKELESRIQMLERQLERLAVHMGDEAGASPPTAREAGGDAPASAPRPVPAALEEETAISEEVLGWASRNAVLPRLAAVCFLMVTALGLRTITDSGVVGKLPGSAIGMGYAAALMAFGWFKYTRNSPLAPVFAACGAILISTIVVETHMHFKALPLVPAYLTLMATGLGMALLSRQFNVFAPIAVGVASMCLAGAAIDYPRPFFPYLSLVLLTANVLGYVAAQQKRCSWLRWLVLVVTMLMLMLWGFGLAMLLAKGDPIPPELAPAWFLPVLLIFFSTFSALSLLGIRSAAGAQISKFDASLPTLNALWAFALAHQVIAAQQSGVVILGVAGLVCTAGYFILSAWCARRPVEGSPGTNTFAFAGATLLALSLPTVSGSLVLSLPAVSLAAIALAVVSRLWQNGSVRATSYLLHLYACLVVTVVMRGEGSAAMDPLNMLPAGILAFAAVSHYQWCRRWPPPADSPLFELLDKKDLSAALLLLCGLVSGFFMVRVAAFHSLSAISPQLKRDAFFSCQSVAINLAVILLISLAYLRRNRELRNMAILVTMVGAAKVFLYDLLNIHGLPLVFSIFSFGLAAAVESVALGRWQKPPAVEATEPE